jgi:hypothetical protein
MFAFAAEGQACDTEMICAWKRTFYTHNYLDSPLRPYYMPRTPNCIGWGASPQPGHACQQPAEIMPSGFERLGRIPNDATLGAIPPAAPQGR